MEPPTASSCTKTAIAQRALETYIALDTSLDGNYRRGARMLQYDLSSMTWNDVLSEYSLRFLGMIHHALQRLYETCPDVELYKTMMGDIDKRFDEEEP